MLLYAFDAPFMGLLAEMSNVTVKEGGTAKDVTCIIIEPASGGINILLGRFNFSSFCFPPYSFVVFLNPAGLSQGEILLKPLYARRNFIY